MAQNLTTISHARPLREIVTRVKLFQSTARVTPAAGVTLTRSTTRSGLCLCRGLPRTAQQTLQSDANWWESDGELWTIVDNEESLLEEIRNARVDLVLVDWFATWCRGCRKSSPALTELALDAQFHGKLKFVKVCTDGGNTVARKYGVRALPWVSVFSREEQECIAGFPALASKQKTFKMNLVVVVNNPGKGFVLDPNGFVVAVNKQDAVEKARSREDAVEELRNFAAGFSDHFSKSPLLSDVPEGGAEKEDEDNGNGAVVGDVEPKPALVSTSDEKKMFLETHGDSYGYGGQIDALYAKEVGCRMEPNEHYMDYTGAAVYCQSQIEKAFEELKSNVFGNPHSQNPSSQLTEEQIEEARALVLRFFKADPKEYQVVFTKSTTAALKMVGETFPWSEGSLFRYLRENHNSVLGIREYVLSHGATFQSVDERLVGAWVRGDHDIEAPTFIREGEEVHNLFAFPAEDNFAGVKYPLSWIEDIRNKSRPGLHWHTVLDAAAYVPTQPLDLSVIHPDFVVCSFYKMFGFPTGLGALVARVSATEILNKVFWAGGSVALSTSKDNFHVLKCRPSDRLEDGTVAFLDIIALKHGFAMLEQLGGMVKIQAHVESLRSWLYKKLISLRHSSGEPLVRIFGKHHMPGAKHVQGGILNIEVLRPDGSPHSYKTFEKRAGKAGFHVRTGIECNPGAAYNYMGILESEVEELAGEKEGCGDDVEYLTVKRPDHEGPSRSLDSDQILYALEGSDVSVGHPAEVGMKWIKVPLGSIRVSLGYMSTFEDCAEFAQFVELEYKDKID